jgi:serine/threonine-protein kinase RsbW
VNGVSVPMEFGSLEAKHLPGHSFAEIRFALSSTEAALVSVVEMVRRAMETLALDNDWVARAELCLQEALLNAHFHGNHGDPERTIRVGCILSSEKIELHVEDEGTGYPVNRDYSNVNTMYPRGRGLFLIHQLMDSVAFNGAGAHIIMSLSRSQNHGNQHYAG